MASNDPVSDTVDDITRGCFGSVLILFGFSFLFGLVILVGAAIA